MRAYRKLLVRRRVLVNLTTGRAVSGVLVNQLGPLLCIKDAQLYQPGSADPVAIDGDVVVDIGNVDFIQAH